MNGIEEVLVRIASEQAVMKRKIEIMDLKIDALIITLQDKKFLDDLTYKIYRELR